MGTSIYSDNLKRLQVAFIKSIGYTIHNKECAIEVLARYEESGKQAISNIKMEGGLLNTKLTFN